MISIKLNDTEIAEMKQFYQEEFNKTLRRLQHIKKVLEKLGDNQQHIEIKVEQLAPTETDNISTPQEKPAILDQEPEEELTVTKRKRKSGPKSIWEPLILKRMRQLNRPLSYDELTQEIMVFAKIPAEKRLTVKQAITNVIFRLRNRDKKLDTFSMGSREKYIALKSWFDDNGDIKKEYKQFLPKKAIKRRPRKQKTI